MFKSPFQLQEKSCSLNDYRIFCFVWFVGWSGAFNACRSLGSVRLPDNAAFTAIPDSLFFECESLQSLAIPQNVTFVGADALNGCDALTAITADESNTVFCSEGGVLYNAGKSTLICHPGAREGSTFRETSRKSARVRFLTVITRCLTTRLSRTV